MFAEQELATLVYPPFKHTWGIHKGTEAKLDMLLDNATDFENPQCLAVTRLEAWDNPKTGKDDDELTAYGVNTGRNQIIYNISMYKLALYGEKGSGEGQFNNPLGIAADPKGDVFVCDFGNGRMVHLFNDGDGLEWQSSFGEDILEEPYDVAITEADTIFVTDRARGTIEVFDYSGKHLKTIENLVAPTSIDVDHKNVSNSRYAARFIMVAEGNGTQLSKLTYDGIQLNSADLNDITANKGKFTYIALDYYDNLWVTDSIACNIHKFDYKLNYITSFGEYGENDGQFDHPTGIAIWRRFGQTVVAESKSAQYMWLGSDILSLNTENTVNRDGEPRLKIDMFLADRSYITIDILKDDEPVRELYFKKRQGQGNRILWWDLRNDDGRRVTPGVYTMKFTIEPTYSSYTYFSKTLTKQIEVE